MINAKRIAALLVCCLVVLVLTTPAYATGTARGQLTLFKLVNRATGEALQFYDAQQPSPRINQYAYKKMAATGEWTTYPTIDYIGQYIYIENAGNHYRLRSLIADSDNVIAVDTLTHAREAMAMVLAPLEPDGDNQLWQLQPEGAGLYSLRVASDEQLVIGAVANHRVQLSAYDGRSEQLWQIVPVDNPFRGEGDAQTAAVQTTATSAHQRIDDWFVLMEDYIAAGRGIDQDGAYGAQCVDLAFNYTHYLFHANLPDKLYHASIAGGNGGDIYDNANPGSVQYYQKMTYQPGFVANRGDLVVFRYHPSRGRGHWGHVAVVESADVNALHVLTINGSEDQPPVKRATYYYQTYANYDYSEIIGFLRPIEAMILSD